MRIQRLVILGILKEGPKHGYQIKKIIQKEMGIFSEFEMQSIYYPLSKMEEEGLVKKKEIKGENNLNKYTYHITPHGEKEFFELCRQILLSQRQPFVELDVALYFLPFLDKKKILPLLRLRLWFLEKVKRWLLEKEKSGQNIPKNLALLLKHHLTLATAERDFLQDMITAVKAGDIK
ncbi:MAG: PadR family transcriptional regulator [Candidatus Omnitrophota bacterium]